MSHIAIIEDGTDIANLLAHGFACEGIEGASPRIHSRVIEL